MHKQNLFATPESWDDLLNWITLHPKSSQIHILTGAMMSWNLACHIHNSTKESDNG
jgi:hypothetical protein